MKLFALCGNPLRKRRTHFYISALYPIVYFSSAARRLSNTVLPFIFVSCSRDFLSLSLYRHLVLWTLGQGPLLWRKRWDISMWRKRERERAKATERQTGRKVEKVYRRAHVRSHTCGINHHRPKDNRKWQSPQSAKSSRCFLSLFSNCRECWSGCFAAATQG